MTEMPEQGAIGLAHLATHALAFGIVGLVEADRDHAVGMAGHDRRAGGMRGGGIGGEEVEGQPALGLFRPGLKRQAQLDQGVEQPVLGKFDPGPAVEIFQDRKIGDRAVMPAGFAVKVRRIRRHQPVAGGMLGVGAEPVALFRCRERGPSAVLLGLLERRNGFV